MSKLEETTQTLYEKYGGHQTISAVVDRFYEKILADASINHFFTQTDMEAQRRHQTAFISFALGGPAYTGRSMERAHAGLNLQPAHFNAVAGHLVATM
ncbi:MAG: group I truncated hemoglobin, partial [Bacillota bacterium]